MAEWATHLSYNFNSPYRAYAYGFGFMYQSGPEQNHGNLTGWGESPLTDLSNYNAGVTQAYYATDTASTPDESPSPSPEQHAVNDPCNYQGSGVVYLGDPQTGLAGSESTSDTDAHTSPDSWTSNSSSSSSKEGSIPQADPASCVEKDLREEASSESSDANGTVTSSLTLEPQAFAATEGDGTNNTTSAPPASPKKPAGVNNPKGKVRAAFSESQMNTLVQRFSVQRYLTPAEMKNLAEVTGLTYKQVKTWFQNRRMKLRRHQKDTSWVSERYSINKESMFTNIPSHIPPYQGEARPPLREQYNQHMMEAAFKNTAPQNLAFYLAAMGSAPGSASYPPWSSNSSQAAVPNRPQMGGWSMPPGVNHYEYNPCAFNLASVNTAVNNIMHDPSFDNKDGEHVNNQSFLNMVHNAGQ